jgi:hypothetical protein
MSPARSWMLCLLLAFVVAAKAATLPGQISPGPGIASGFLARLARSSAYIFAGTVISVSQTPPESSGGIPSVSITFRVDQSIQGTRTGQMLTIREWTGLWERGDRYRPGERVVLFLHQPSRLGLTSPVEAAMGRYAVNRDGTITLDPARAPALLPASIPTNLRRPIRITTHSFARRIRLAGRE